MRFELPECRRCCLCVPLRYGIIIFGYLNLAFAILIISLEIWIELLTKEGLDSETMVVYKGVGFYSHLWVAIILYALEIVFNVLLLVGAHAKNLRLLGMFYYYGVTTALASFLMFFVVTIFYNNFNNRAGPAELVECSVAFSGFVLQVYLLLLVRSELTKRRYQNSRYTYVNHMSEIPLDSRVEMGSNPL